MKFAAGVFAKEDVKDVVAGLKAAGFSESDLSLLTAARAETAVDLVRQEPEESVPSGAMLGGALGSVMGLLGSVAMVPIAGIGPMLASGLLSSATGGAVGAFLGSIYSVRAESEPTILLKEALADGRILVIARAETHAEAATAEQVMRAADGDLVDTYDADNDPGGASTA